MSETARYRSLTRKYCFRPDGEPGCGVDIASQGGSVVPWAMGLDLPKPEFDAYCGGAAPHGPIQLRGHADKLPFDDASLDFVYSSHLIEDFLLDDWPRLMTEWKRVLKPGGYMIVLAPEKERWNYAITQLGQCPNCSHKHEPVLGELGAAARQAGMEVVCERLTEQHENDYSILMVARKV